MTTTPTRGRPRSEPVRQAILSAAVALIKADGYGVVTIEAIARRAGVSKQTVYRWWPGKAEIVLEALNENAAAVAPQPDTGALETDLRAFLRSTAAGATGPTTRLLGALMAESQLDPEFAQSFRDDFLARRRAVLRALLERARARGEVAAGADLELVAEVVFGTVWYRILNQHAKIDRRFADQMTGVVLALVSHASTSRALASGGKTG